MIYALVDKETLIQKSVSLHEYIQHISPLPNIPILQYRNKSASMEEKKEDLLLIRQYYDGNLIVYKVIGSGLYYGIA